MSASAPRIVVIVRGLHHPAAGTLTTDSQEQRDQLGRDHAALRDHLVESGEWVGGNALADPSQARALRPGLVTDGPFIEAKEHLAGYDLLDCDNADRALEIATQYPHRHVCGIELRPIMDV